MADEPPYLYKRLAGDALNTRGFVAYKTVDYVSMMVNGLFWDAYAIWTLNIPEDTVTSTTWTDATPSVSTTWTPFLYDVGGVDLPY